MASPWIDVSLTPRTGMDNWPGDSPARISHALGMEGCDPCTVSLLEMDAHTGTHMDAPAHFVCGGIGIDKMPLDAAIGLAREIPIRSETAAEHLAARPTDPELRVRLAVTSRWTRRGAGSRIV